MFSVGANEETKENDNATDEPMQYFLLSAYFAAGFIVYLLSASPAVFQSIAHHSRLL